MGTMMRCDVCRGEKTIRVATYPELNACDEFSGDAIVPDVSDPGWKEFPCPQCCMVPYRRVRAMKVMTSYPAEEFARIQVPIERSLAARFGEYLLREGLIRFSTSGSTDLGERSDKVTVTAHLGVVSRADTRRAEAVEEVATSKAPPLPERLRKRARVSERALRWQPPVDVSFPADDPVTDEFDDEPKSALGARFSGLEI